MATTILALSANPKDASRLRIDEEIRNIQEGLQLAENRAQFEFKVKRAVRTRDIRRAILSCKPKIIHFSGQGEKNGKLALENDDGFTQVVSPEALSELFKLFSKELDCVFLNACFSEIQASAIARYIKYVVGVKDDLNDRTAIEFAVGFYDGIGAGWSIERAYELGRNAIALSGEEKDMTILKTKQSSLENKHSTNEGCRKSSEPHTLGKQKEPNKTRFEVVFKGSLEDLDQQSIEEIFNYLKDRLEDPTLTIKLVQEGSIKITFEGSVEGFELLSQLVAHGEIEDVAGFPIQKVRELEEVMVSADRKKEKGAPIGRKRGQALKQEGIEVIQEQLANKGWTQQLWADYAFISLSTVKRLLRGEQLDQKTLYSALESLGIDLNGLSIQKQIRQHGLDSLSEETHSQPGFFMTGTFANINRSRLKLAIQHLQKLLTDSQVTYHEDQSGVTVTGVFEESKRQHIEMAIQHIEKELSSCEVTW